MGTSNGRYVWFDLVTTDVPKAKAFYSDVAGWQTTRWPGGDYEMWSAGDRQVGGIMQEPPEERQAGLPPRWLAYIGIDDVDATAKKAQELGGRILVAPKEIPDVGRFAVLADPQGAAFAVFQPSAAEEAPDRTALGSFGWLELNTTDWQSAWKFYSGLFGWQKTSSMDMGPDYGEYLMFGTDPKEAIGGMSNTAAIMKTPAHWLPYVNVKNADETTQEVEKNGGKALNGPMDVPGGGRIAQCMDPQGAMFAIFSAARH